ncbi:MULTISPECIES: DUF6624 domain-containing protein [unclassified Streptomyces]|uniref:DUF6624 domain-containing protein n=1 Tax=unclassified Streptomyces TaxID=2593676 RepID=UPI0038070714
MLLDGRGTRGLLRPPSRAATDALSIRVRLTARCGRTSRRLTASRHAPLVRRPARPRATTPCPTGDLTSEWHSTLISSLPTPGTRTPEGRSHRGGRRASTAPGLPHRPVLVAAGELQVYGTQYTDDADGSNLRLQPVTDPDQLDERRAAVGLEPSAEYDRRMRGLKD